MIAGYLLIPSQEQEYYSLSNYFKPFGSKEGYVGRYPEKFRSPVWVVHFQMNISGKFGEAAPAPSGPDSPPSGPSPGAIMPAPAPGEGATR